MIAMLTGKVVEREDRALILDVSGVGYRVLVTSGLREASPVGSTVVVRTYHHVNDQGQLLFGFKSKEDLHYFEMLLKVPSVGPRTAMNILDVAPMSVLEQAVAEEDTKVLTKVSGVGKRTAERILVELKEKIVVTGRTAAPGSIQHETVEALVAIGFNPKQARDVVQKLPKDVSSVEEAVKAALKTKV